MSLADKYGDVLGLAQKVGVKGGNWKEEGGKIHLWGTTPYQLDANLLWDEIKKHPGPSTSPGTAATAAPAVRW
jgi:hypothetical protein